MQCFRHFFLRMDTPSSNKTNNVIPSHLIISKHKYYGLKLYILMICSCTYILLLLSIASQIDGYKIHPIFQPIEKRVRWKIKWLKNQMISKWSGKKYSICKNMFQVYMLQLMGHIWSRSPLWYPKTVHGKMIKCYIIYFRHIMQWLYVTLQVCPNRDVGE
jgi:hypothetical protein